MRPWLPLLLLLVPGVARAGGEVRILADVLLSDPVTFEGGSLIGPPESRATWYGYGGIEPFEGPAMLVFSTGEVGGDPLPGTDLGAAGADNDIAGINLTLRAPEDARSVRIAVRVLAPDAPGAPELAGDMARVLVHGDPIALDPWTLGPLGTEGPVMTTARPQELAGTPFAPPDGVGTGWLEAVVPVEPGSQLAVRLEVRDGADDAWGDFVLLADGLRFDSGVPEDVQPGHAPLLTGVGPERIPEELATTVLLSGRHLPPDLQVSLLDPAGQLVHEVPSGDLSWRSTEQVELNLPPLPAGLLSVRLAWSGGRLRWDAALEVDTPPPRITGVSPDTGPTAGGGLVAVTGVGFIEVSRLTLGDQDISELAVLSPEHLEFVVPPGEPGPAALEVFAHGGFAELPAAYTRSEPAEQATDPATPGTGPALTDCDLAAGRAAPGLLLLLSPGWWLLGRRRAGRAGRRPASG